MRSAVLAMIVVCLTPRLARADDSLHDQAVELIERWTAAQNNGDGDAYADCYAAATKPSERLQKPTHVEASHIEVFDLPEHEMRATFTLMRERAKAGALERKQLTIGIEQGAFHIRRDATLSASNVSASWGHRCDPVCSPHVPPRSLRRELRECEVACAADAGNCVRYADVYAGGQCGVDRDMARAIEIVDEACRRQEPAACLSAAQSLEHRSKIGDVTRAIAILEPHCRSARNCVGIDVFTRLLRKRNENDDAARALRMWNAACANDAEPGDAAKACGTAAEMYATGEGVAPDPRRARELRARAARLWRVAGKPSCCAE